MLFGEAIVVSEKKEHQYYNSYEIKITKKQGKFQKYKEKVILNVNPKKVGNLNYGDKIKFQGKYIKPSESRNYGGFDYQQYLKTLKIYGTIKLDKVKILEKNKAGLIATFLNNSKKFFREKIKEAIEQEDATMLNGILFGYTDEIEENIKNNFKITNISHVLAVSGLHVVYLTKMIEILFKKRIGSRKNYYITIIFLIFYAGIAGFSPSIIRASVTTILIIISKLVHRKNDVWNLLSIAILITVMINPFSILNLGLQYSYLGTIGILLFQKVIFKFLKKIKIKNNNLNKKTILIIDKIKEVLSVTISVQLMLFPVLIFYSNQFGVYFLISNLLISFLIGPLLLIGLTILILAIIFMPLAKFIGKLTNGFICLFKSIGNLANLPLSKIYIPTPSKKIIILYYLFLFTFLFLYHCYNDIRVRQTQMRVRNIIALLKLKIKDNKKIYSKYLVTFIILLIISYQIPKNLKIHFVDVGQGDCTFIETPHRKTILIDGGGSLSKDIDIGKNTLLPYILDRGYTKIDIVIISHFDQDHVGGILTILEELNVKEVWIAKQEENSLNYDKFIKIVKEKNIPVKIMKQGTKKFIEKNLAFEVLWPIKEQIKEKQLNNNSLILNMRYNNESFLLTGDIEQIAEKKIIEKYKEENYKLKANILKVAHHGSKSSSTEEMLDIIDPKIALIGVGKNNLFGHPSNEIIERLKKRKIKIYRTDKNGEITLKINKKKIKEIQTKIKNEK